VIAINLHKPKWPNPRKWWQWE